MAEEGATNDPVARAVARADVEIEPFLRAYRTSPSGVRLVPAPSGRAWMDATTNRFANRCLPLKMPNQAGWFVLNDRPVRVVWDGGKEISSTKVEPLREVGDGEHRLCEPLRVRHSHLLHSLPLQDAPRLQPASARARQHAQGRHSSS